MSRKPYYRDTSVSLFHGECLNVLAVMDGASVDAVVTDPPYGLEFMGKEWDRFAPSSARIRTRVDSRTNPTSGKSVTVTPEAYVAGVPYQKWCQQWATECLRLLKPGGHLLAFGGARTFHRLVCAVEDAGFEVRDTISWLYGSGFPKSLDVSKAIDKAAGADREVVGIHRRHGGGRPESSSMSGPLGTGSELPLTAPATEDAARWQGWGTALKPGWEPIVVARKPLAGTVATNVLAHGTGALNVDGCRIKRREGDRTEYGVDGDKAQTTGESGIYGRFAEVTPYVPHDSGRWPTNVVLSHCADCGEDCEAGCPVAQLDQQSGVSTSRIGVPRSGAAGSGWRLTASGAEYDDAGGASRFFPAFRYEAKADGTERPRHNGIAHPTVKPLDLMRWLVRLVTVPGGLVLDPFAGSGTTAEACVIEGLRCLAIEQEADYLPLIVGRLSKPIQGVLPLEVLS